MAQENTLADAITGLRSFKDAHQRAFLNQQELDATTESMRAVNDVDDLAADAAQDVRSNHHRMAGVLRQALTALIRMFRPTLNISTTDRGTILRELQQYMRDNSIEIKSRTIVLGNPVDDGGNFGDQTFHVQKLDRNNHQIESATIETITIEAVATAAGRGTLGQETYSIRGEGRADRSEFDGVGRGVQAGLLNSLEPGVSSILNNSSFDSTFIGTGVDKIPSWDIVSGDTVIARDTATIARNRGSANHASLAITGNCELRFYFRRNGVALSRFLSYIQALRWEADAAAAGATITYGTTAIGSIAVVDTSGAFLTDVAALTTAAWLENFTDPEDPYFKIVVSGYAGGTIHIDDAMFRGMAMRGGLPGEIVSGVTPPRIGDLHTQARALTVNTAGSVDLTGGASGSLDSILVGGVELLAAPIPFDTSLAVTAQNAVDHINESLTSPNYRAARTSNRIDIFQIVPVEGTITVVSASTTITTTDVNISGATIGLIQDSIVRSTGTYLPHAASATADWEDAA